MELQLEGATLSNLAEGSLEEQFQACLTELASLVLGELGAYEESGGVVTSKIKLEVVFGTQTQAPFSTMVSVRAELNRPKRKFISRSVYRKGDEWLVADEPKQQPLAFPRAINKEV